MSLALLLILPLAPSPQETLFVDESETYGVSFKHGDSAFAYAMGGGSAWFDYDNDGDQDLFAANTDGRHELYRNINGVQFEIATEGSGLKNPSVDGTIGVIAADYDGDGWVDLFLASTNANRLMQNQGDGTFVDRAFEEGVASSSWSAAAAFADFDLDGDLDLYVGNYVESLNFPYHYGGPNQFYENLGPDASPRFVERAAELGVDDVDVFGPTVPGFPYISPEGQNTAGCTLSICTVDYDEDGDQDLLVGNDFGQWVTPNKLYRNDIDLGQGLAFTDVTVATGFDTDPHYNMGIAAADYDRDGDWDFYKSNLGDNLLLRNDGGTFSNVVYEAGPVSGVNDEGSLLLSSWGFVWADFDLDLDEDLYVVNGLIPAATFILNDTRAANDLHLNQGDGTFVRVAPEESGAADESVGRGVAPADVNRDGFMDFYVMNNGAAGVALPEDRSRLYIAQPDALDPSGQRRALQLELRAVKSPWQAFGARVTAEVGGWTLKRQVLCDPVFVSSAAREVHFGVGTAVEVGRVTVDWPSGTEQRLVGVPAGAQLVVVEPTVLATDLAPIALVAGSEPRAELRLGVANTDANAKDAAVLFTVRLGASGPLVYTGLESVALAGDESTDVVHTIPVDPAVIALLQGQGLSLDVRAYVGESGAIDSRRRVDLLP